MEAAFQTSQTHMTGPCGMVAKKYDARNEGSWRAKEALWRWLKLFDKKHLFGLYEPRSPIFASHSQPVAVHAGSDGNAMPVCAIPPDFMVAGDLDLIHKANHFLAEHVIHR